MGGGQIFLKSLRDTSFNKDLSNEPNFGRIHLAGPAFYSPRKVNLKIGLIPDDGLPNSENGQIPEDDLPRKAKFRKKRKKWEWPDPERWLTENGQIPANEKSESQKRIWWNRQPKAIFQGPNS